MKNIFAIAFVLFSVSTSFAGSGDGPGNSSANVSYICNLTNPPDGGQVKLYIDAANRSVQFSSRKKHEPTLKVVVALQAKDVQALFASKQNLIVNAAHHNTFIGINAGNQGVSKDGAIWGFLRVSENLRADIGLTSFTDDEDTPVAVACYAL